MCAVFAFSRLDSLIMFARALVWTVWLVYTLHRSWSLPITAQHKAHHPASNSSPFASLASPSSERAMTSHKEPRRNKDFWHRSRWSQLAELGDTHAQNHERAAGQFHSDIHNSLNNLNQLMSNHLRPYGSHKSPKSRKMWRPQHDERARENNLVVDDGPRYDELTPLSDGTLFKPNYAYPGGDYDLANQPMGIVDFTAPGADSAALLAEYDQLTDQQQQQQPIGTGQAQDGPPRFGSMASKNKKEGELSTFEKNVSTCFRADSRMVGGSYFDFIGRGVMGLHYHGRGLMLGGM